MYKYYLIFINHRECVFVPGDHMITVFTHIWKRQKLWDDHCGKSRYWLSISRGICIKHGSKPQHNITSNAPNYDSGAATHGHMWRSPLHPLPLWLCCSSARSPCGGSGHSPRSSSSRIRFRGKCCPARDNNQSQTYSNNVSITYNSDLLHFGRLFWL